MAFSQGYKILWFTGIAFVILPHLNLGLLSDYKICGDSECESKFETFSYCLSSFYYTMPSLFEDIFIYFKVFCIYCIKAFFVCFCVSAKCICLFACVFVCTGLLSRVQAIRDHHGKDCRFLSFRRGDSIFVYHKLTGKREDLWAGTVSLLFYLISLICVYLSLRRI